MLQGRRVLPGRDISSLCYEFLPPVALQIAERDTLIGELRRQIASNYKEEEESYGLEEEQIAFFKDLVFKSMCKGPVEDQQGLGMGPETISRVELLVQPYLHWSCLQVHPLCVGDRGGIPLLLPPLLIPS